MTKLEAAALISKRLKDKHEEELLKPDNERDSSLKAGKKIDLQKLKTKKFKTITIRTITQIIDIFFDLLKEKMLEGEKLEFRGFGSFERRSRKPRKAINPKTKEIINLEYRYIPYFKPSNELKKLFKNYNEKNKK